MIYINYLQYGICFKNKNKIYDRLNGPAHFNGNIQIWYQNGEYHRLDGPAVIGAQRREYWIEDVFFHESQYNEKMKNYSEKK
jgi:hypothetical protein